MLKKTLTKPFVKFLVVGGLNTAFGYFTFSVFIFTTGNTYLSVLLSTAAGVLFNFKTYGIFVFNSKDNSKAYKFFAVYAFIIIMQMLSLNWMRYLGVANPYLAAAIIILPMSTLSFVLMRKFVFYLAPVIEVPKDNDILKKS